MTPTETYRALLKVINAETKRLGGIQDRHIKGIQTRLLNVLNDPKFRFETYGPPDYRIRPTAANLSRINTIIKQSIGKLYPLYWVDGLQVTSNGFELIEKLNAEYMAGQAQGFRNKPSYKSVTESAIQNTLANFNRDGTREFLEKPLRSLLTEYVRTGSSFNDMVEMLDKALNNEPVQNRKTTKVDEPFIKRQFTPYHQVKRIARDGMFQYSRSYVQSVSTDLGFEFYRYIGGIVEDSREFCLSRVGKTWHVSEIQEWPSLTWDGKIPGTNTTNIFTNLGGYNCRHSVLPVAFSVVPEEDRQRMRSKGIVLPN